MQSSTFPRVRDGVLRFTNSAADEPAPVSVGSTEWYDRLDQIASFGFEDQIGRSFIARREQREQQWYWYAYRKRGKKLRKVYLGKTDQLEPARLQAAARELARSAARSTAYAPSGWPAPRRAGRRRLPTLG